MMLTPHICDDRLSFD